MRRTINNSGFTMVEMLVVVGILTVIGAGVTNVFLNTFRGGGRAGLIARIKQEGDFAITTMERYIRNGRDITVCTSPMNTLQVQSLTIPMDFEVITATTDRVRYTGPGGQRFLTSDQVDVTSLQFDCSPGNARVNDTVTITLTLTDVNNILNETFKTSVVLRTIN